jgi:hypothetical protein
MLWGRSNYVFYLHLVIVVSAIITLALGVAYGRKLASAPLQRVAEHFPERRASSWYTISMLPSILHLCVFSDSRYNGNSSLPTTSRMLALYSGFMPLLTLAHAAADAALYRAGLLHPFYALTGAVVFCLGWCVQTFFWSICYGDNSYDQGVCPEQPLTTVFYGGVAAARLAFAVWFIMLYLAYMAMAASAVNEYRRHATVRMRPGSYLERSAFQQVVSEVELGPV